MSKPVSPIPLESFSTFGDLLKYLRRRARLTQRELSIAVKYSEAQISRLEQNQRPPDLAALTALFVPALYIDDEPEIVARLLELGAKARGEELPQDGAVTLSRSVQHKVLENSRTVEEEVRNNLPLQLTSFVGREREIDHLKNLLHNARLVTLTGSGGCGKTRLAIEAARQFAGSYADGIWLIELAPVSDPNLISPILTSGLGISTSHEAEPRRALTRYLRTKQTLLILDNCEQILAGVAHLVAEILQACPQVRILVTSREILNAYGEVQFRLPALSLPEERSSTRLEALRSEAVQLFVERAQTVLPHFNLTDQAASAVSEICQLVDGLPLGLELAAAKVSVLSVDQIAARLHDSFQMLSKGRDAVPHHQTLEATIQWSYDLLSESERVLLQRLAVFSGGWTLEAAETVTCDETLIPREKVLELLSQLVNKSLVVVGWQIESEARYTLLQTIHEFAGRKLHEAGDWTEMRAQHFKYFLSLSQQARLFGKEKGRWLDRLEAEHENLRLALGWSLEAHVPEQGAALILTIVDFYWFRGFSAEAREWMDRFIARAMEPSPLRALLLQKAGWLTRASGDFERANILLERALNLALEIGDKNRAAWALMDLGLSLREQGNHEKEISSIARALTFAQESGENRAIGVSLYNLAESRELTGDLDTSAKLWKQGLDLFRADGDQTHIAWGLEGLAGTAYLAEDYAGALKFHLESLKCKIDVMDKLGIAYSFEGLAQVAATIQAPERAVVLWGAASYLRERMNVPLEPSRENMYTSLLPLTRSQMGEEAFDRAWKKGRAITLQEAIEFALMLPGK
jgi:predicted ATPase/transcriptional regulator with XRE-family HTH domain